MDLSLQPHTRPGVLQDMGAVADGEVEVGTEVVVVLELLVGSKPACC